MVPPAGTSLDAWHAEEWECETCVRRCHLDALSDRDRRVFALYRDLAEPVVREFHLVPLVFQAHGLAMTRDSIRPLLLRLGQIHRTMVEVAERKAKRKKTDG